MFAELRPYRITDSGFELHVKVTPRASKERIGESYSEPDGTNVLRIYVTVAPEDGKANKAVISLLTKKLGTGKSSITIAKGLTDQRKVILITDKNAEPALKLL